MREYWQNYVDGEFIDGGAGKIQVDDPGTEKSEEDEANCIREETIICKFPASSAAFLRRLPPKKIGTGCHRHQ